MAKLIWRCWTGQLPDDVQIAWEGTADQCLGAALEFLQQSHEEFRQKVVAGEIDAVTPEMAMAIAYSPKLTQFNVQLRSEGGYAIWYGEGADLYVLID